MSVLLLSGESAVKLGYYTTSQITATYTATSTAVTGTSYTYSDVYTASGSTRVPCVEQIFTQATDPQPGTEDWTLAITSFQPSAWDEFQMTASAYSNRRRAEIPPSPICRACYPPEPTPYNGLSARFPVDGVNTGFPWANPSSALENFWATSNWLPVSKIAGSANEDMYACVSVFNSMYDSVGSSNSQLRQAWSEGKRTSIKNGLLYGAVQFRKSSEVTGTITYTYTATAVSSEYHVTNKFLGV